MAEAKKKEKELQVDLSALSLHDYQALKEADEEDLRALLTLLAMPTDMPHTPSATAELIGMSEAELQASVKYWKGAGVLSLKNAQKEKNGTQAPKASTAAPSAHRDGKLERSSEMPTYSTEELTALIERNRITAQFIDESQRILGRMFNTHEINLLVGMVDYVGLEEEAVLILLTHMAAKGKKTLRYIEKVAYEMYDLGITTAKALEEYLRRKEQLEATEHQIQVMFGMVGRALTTKEKKFLHHWCDEMGYGEDVIRLAYDITVDAIHEPAPAYANSILEKWHAEGLQNVEQVQAYLDSQKKDSKPTAGSFDTDSFFDAALRRSVDEFLN